MEMKAGGNGKNGKNARGEKVCTGACLTEQAIINGILAATGGKLTLKQASEIDIEAFRKAVRAHD
jgi:hypothetical protein